MQAAHDARAFADRLPFMVWTYDQRGVVDWVNRVTAPEAVAALVPDVIRMRTSETIVRMHRLDAPAGQTRWHRVRIEPIFGDDGALAYWLGSATDVHEQRMRVKKRDDDLAAFAQAIPQIVWQATAGGSFEFFNDRWYDYTGLGRRSSMGDGWLSAVHPDDVRIAAEAWSAAVRGEAPYEVEFRIRARDRTRRWFLARATPMRDAAGSVVRWFGTCTDIDDAKRAQAALIDSERQARVLADVLPMILFTMSPDGALTTVNQRWVEFTGLDLDASRAVWATVIHADDADTALRFLDAIRMGERFVAEFRLRRVDGEYRWMRTIAEPVRDEAGTIVRYVGATIDIQDARDARDVLLRELEREHRASAAFQQAALPAALPVIPGLAFDAVYSAARSEALVGGDWYDVFRLTDGRVVLSIGDVSGSGLDAAVTMGAVRQAIRGAAQIYPDPAAVLDAADRTLRSEQPERIVTAFAAVFDPLTSNLTYATAGHPAPLVRREDGRIVELSARGLPLGLRPARNDDASQTIVLETGSVVVLYTDGLIEATRDLLAGERLLHEALGRAGVIDSAQPARSILEAVVADPIDDVAILTVRVGVIPTARWSIAVTDGENVRGVRYAVADRLRESGASDEDVITAELLFSELVGNVLRHSGGVAEIALDATGDYPVLHVLDRGAGFTFHARLPNDVMSESGRGLFIASMLARDLSVVPRSDGGSHARAVLPRTGAARAPVR